MPVRFRYAKVLRVIEESPGSQVIEARIEDGDEPAPVRAFHDCGLLGRLAPGDRVALNTSARRMGLGTGGVDFVVWVAGRLPAAAESGGHIMKLRYTPLQRPVLAVEEPGHPLRDAYLQREAAGLAGRPVVALELHSQVAAAAAGARAAGARQVWFVQTEGGALPAGFSRLVPHLRSLGWIAGVVSAGHAYGGDVEAVSYPSALLAAAAAGADVILAGPGPGIAGTGTRYGHSAVEQAWILDAAAALGGRAVACPRLSAADPRPRHRPVSHHTLTVLDLARDGVWVPLPAPPAPGDGPGAGEDAGLAALIGAARRRLLALPAASRHGLVEVDAAPALALMARAGINPRSMGRTAADDPTAFLAAGAAGVLAGILAGRPAA